jgi:hypothetical protein
MDNTESDHCEDEDTENLQAELRISFTSKSRQIHTQKT